MSSRAAVLFVSIIVLLTAVARPASGQNAPLYPAPMTPAPAPPAESAPVRHVAPRDYHVDLGLSTEFPLSAGGQLTAELPHRFLLQLGVGVMPRAYAEAIDGLLTKMGAYDSVVSSVVQRSLKDSLVIKASLGGRPFADHGFEILGGYTLVTMGGSVATSDIVNAVLLESGTSYQLPAGVAGDYPVSATLHNIHATLGWRWLVASDRLVLRATLSYVHTLGSKLGIKVPETATAVLPYEALINEKANALVGPYIVKYAHLPTLGLSAAFRF